MDLASKLLFVVVFCAGGLIAFHRRQSVSGSLRAFFREPDYAINLSATRVVFFAYVVYSRPWEHSARYAGLPNELLVAPDGTQWLADLGTASPAVVRVLSGVMLVSSVLALIGLFSRTSSAVFVAVGLYVLWLPEAFGKVDHGHHVLWVALLLAISPSGDSLSVDSWRRRRAGTSDPEKSQIYGFPLRVLWLLMGMMYFFPGLFKFASGGIQWASPENLTSHAWLTWHSFDRLPSIRLDELPDVVVWAGGIGTLIFEMGFIFAMFSRRLRPIAALTGFLFHVGTFLTLLISFKSLMVLYASFLPWHLMAGWIDQRRNEKLPGTAEPIAVNSERRSGRWLDRLGPAIAGVLLVSVAAAGSTNLMNGWPVASYPVFPYTKATTTQVVSVTVVDAGGEKDLFASNAALVQWMPRYKVLRMLQANDDAEGARAIAAAVSCGLDGGVERIMVTSGTASADPSRWGESLTGETVLVDIAFANESQQVPEGLAFADC